MGLMESLFDLTYLMLVIGMGVRLLLEKNKMQNYLELWRCYWEQEMHFTSCQGSSLI